MNKMPPILYVHAEAAIRALHWWYGHRILVSDNRANVLRIVANTFAQDHRHVLKTTPEELRRLILEQWGEGTRYLPLGESPPLRPVVDIDGRAAMDYATRVALSTYLTSFVLEGNGRRRPSEAALVSTIDSRRLPMNAHQPASDDPMDDQLSRLSAEARDLHEEMEGAEMASARGEISESEAHARVCSALVKLQTLPAADRTSRPQKPQPSSGSSERDRSWRRDQRAARGERRDVLRRLCLRVGQGDGRGHQGSRA